MYDDQFQNSEEEREAAQDRIDRIRGGGSPPPAAGRGLGAEADAFGDLEGDAISRVRERSRAARAALEDIEAPSRARTPAGRGARGAAMIAGIVVIGVVVIVVIILAAKLVGGGGGGLSLPFLATDTPTPTVTPTPTETALPTETATPTKEAPALALPPLTCIFQSGEGCYDYCQNPDNAGECDSAKEFIRAQGADPDVWLECLAPGPGPNQGNPQQCLEDAWRANNP